ncbi:unnamed protein product [Aphanomyces euteiches]|uniref:PDZ domain-containing protein n=1 Tax=Aphanomyces euteiches TaxID=100861 RepID=A0A6G0WTQ7_9STRA|nr:hypothetical protein Ae201684_011821 [Aphanomyces euteiches]KAH9089220.1 hypothetical protein Ae201684P_001425 [Aphanomyces euteiches]KAH9138961.1 hypothetical protein AeRB84_016757 [Aphanomyces euteiches]
MTRTSKTVPQFADSYAKLDDHRSPWSPLSASTASSSSSSSFSSPASSRPAIYDVVWEGGDLGIVLATPSLTVSHISSRARSRGIQFTKLGDVFIGLNGVDMRPFPFRVVLQALQECPFPATLHLARHDVAPMCSMAAAAPPKRERLAFTPPAAAAAIANQVTSPRHAKGVATLLESRPAAKWAHSKPLYNATRHSY